MNTPIQLLIFQLHVFWKNVKSENKFLNQDLFYSVWPAMIIADFLLIKPEHRSSTIIYFMFKQSFVAEAHYTYYRHQHSRCVMRLSRKSYRGTKLERYLNKAFVYFFKKISNSIDKSLIHFYFFYLCVLCIFTRNVDYWSHRYNSTVADKWKLVYMKHDFWNFYICSPRKKSYNYGYLLFIHLLKL